MHLLLFFTFISTLLIPATLASHYAIFFLPHSPITQFQTTLIIPPPSPDIHLHGNNQAVWSGLQPEVTASNAATSGVWQNLVINDGQGEWRMMPEYCCSPVKPYDNMKIYQNDTLTSLFTRYSDTFRWMDYWNNVPGTIGSQNGEIRIDNAINFDSRDFPGLGPFTEALLAIEMQGNTDWDFGVVEWRNVVIEAETKGTDWCVRPVSTNGFTVDMPDKPTAMVDGNKVRCSVKKILMVKDH